MIRCNDCSLKGIRTASGSKNRLNSSHKYQKFSLIFLPVPRTIRKAKWSEWSHRNGIIDQVSAVYPDVNFVTNKDNLVTSFGRSLRISFIIASLPLIVMEVQTIKAGHKKEVTFPSEEFQGQPSSDNNLLRERFILPPKLFEKQGMLKKKCSMCVMLSTRQLKIFSRTLFIVIYCLYWICSEHFF